MSIKKRESPFLQTFPANGLAISSVIGQNSRGDINSGRAKRAATRYAPMKSGHSTQHHSLSRLHRISHYTVISPNLQQEMGLVFRFD